MGMIDTALALVFGDGRNVVRDTVEVFRANAEKTAGRDATAREQAMVQFGAEFAVPRKGRFDRFMDGLNKAGIEIDRKILADMAGNEPAAFAALAETAKKHASAPHTVTA